MSTRDRELRTCTARTPAEPGPEWLAIGPPCNATHQGGPKHMTRTALWSTVIAAALWLVLAASAVGPASASSRAAAVAKRAASARVERFGISYPSSAWKADCARRSGGGWRCAVGTSGQCSGVVTVTGTSVRARVRNVDVSCFD